MKPILNWVEERTGLGSAIGHFLNEDIPASSGWKHVLGSVAMFAFLLQATTGVLLALNYAPTPGEAWSSLRYIIAELTGGAIIRSMHHWGASMMIIVVGLHMAQVFLWGAYKKPREATWLVGAVLLILTLSYGLTGYLLPWDNRAYWGTVVTVQITGSAPILGPHIQRLLGADGGNIGAITFARFYAIHVLVLPPITALLIAFHVYLVRKHGVAPRPGETATKKFYPSQVFKDTVAIFVAFAGLVAMSIVAKVPLGNLADPTDTSYIPRPEWYFLFLFQLLKLFEGPLEIIGSFVLPNLALAALFGVPFIDRSKVAPIAKRTVAMAALALAGLAWAGLTAAAMKSTPVKNEYAKALELAPESWQQITAEELAAVGVMRNANCSKCHAPKSSRKPAEFFGEHVKEKLPGTELTEKQTKLIATFTSKLRPDSEDAFAQAPAHAVRGAMLYQSNNCFACHQVNGVGMKLGPPLNGVANRREKQWLLDHFADPQKLSPGTSMPPYKLPADDLDALTRYMLALPR